MGDRARGRRRHPVLVVVHGGPASSSIPFNPQLRDWEAHFIVVQWDQRGAGVTYLRHGADDRLTVDRLVADGQDLLAWTASRFSQCPVVLLGSSVGSVVATRMADRSPDLVDGLVLANALGPGARAESWRLTRDALLARGRTKDVATLDGVGPDPAGWFPEQAETVSKLAIEANPAVPHMIYDLMLPALMYCPDYSLSDLRALEASMALARDRLYPELCDPDLCDAALVMPVLVVQGEGDLVNPVPSARRLAESLDAQLVTVPDVGHLVELAQPRAVLDALLAFRSSSPNRG
ncbi:alpha/beta hydrolase [Arsenicicoccus piscis]|uniref:alpha/beta fold hydrolase n=1 Tax=Arsenicicoccus piscis TaxID=673954 RepID=UPI001F4CC694|nr:alpha/beta hydrolase [Arsenicicoccus piscis]